MVPQLSSWFCIYSYSRRNDTSDLTMKENKLSLLKKSKWQLSLTLALYLMSDLHPSQWDEPSIISTPWVILHTSRHGLVWLMKCKLDIIRLLLLLLYVQGKIHNNHNILGEYICRMHSEIAGGLSKEIWFLDSRAEMIYGRAILNERWTHNTVLHVFQDWKWLG